MNKQNQNMARLIPVINFAGTFFYADTELNEFRQVNAPGNTISMKEVGATMEEPTEFALDRNTRNIYQDIIDPENIPAHVTLVTVPPLKELQAVNVTQKNTLPYDGLNRRVKRIKRNKSSHRL